MKFANEINPLDHPHAHLIPYAIWMDLFDQTITDHELEFLEFDLEIIEELAEEVFLEPDEDSFKLWLCILLGHKDKTADELAEFGWNLELDTVILWKAACIANRADLLQLMLVNFEDKAQMLSKLMLEDDCYGFRYAAQTGSVDVLKWHKSNTPEELFPRLVESFDYWGFAAAAEFGHLSVLQWFKQEVDAVTLTTMIENNNFCAFRVAAEFGRIDILDWLREQVSDKVFESIDLRNVMQPFEDSIKNRPSLLEWFRKEDLKGFQVVPTFFTPISIKKRPANDLVEPELEGNGFPGVGQ
jgi:hypothetical protein